MVNGIPVILCYKQGNNTFIPDDVVTGANPNELHSFFTRVGKLHRTLNYVNNKKQKNDHVNNSFGNNCSKGFVKRYFFIFF